MNQSEYIKLLRLARTAIEEYKNWGEDELVSDKSMQVKSTKQQEIKNTLYDIQILVEGKYYEKLIEVLNPLKYVVGK